jgi:phosphoribosylaminoimidazole-succinocarboxamide synthase
METGSRIYEGKAKILYETENPDLVIQYFKDDATAFDGKKRGTIGQKGVCNNRISARLFQILEKSGIRTHFVRPLSDREMLVRRLKILPVEVVVRNIAFGSLVKRYGIEAKKHLKPPLVEFYLKNDALGDPLIYPEHAVAMGLARPAELATLRKAALKVNGILKRFFQRRGLTLVDFKLEFGRHKGRILLGDEISPDTCRLWDSRTGEIKDKDRFRKDLGQVEDAYREVLERVEGKEGKG